MIRLQTPVSRVKGRMEMSITLGLVCPIPGCGLPSGACRAHPRIGAGSDRVSNSLWEITAVPDSRHAPRANRHDRHNRISDVRVHAICKIGETGKYRSVIKEGICRARTPKDLRNVRHESALRPERPVVPRSRARWQGFVFA
jgi:hypothetical protein